MGVGVYESNFDGMGTSFLVSGPLGTDEDYAAYAKACRDARDEFGPVDREQWTKDQYDGENELLVELVASFGTTIEMTPSRRKGFRSDAVDFDREISSLAAGDLVEVGWRSWQHDFVIAVGPTSRAQDMLSLDATAAALEYGRSPEGLKADYDALVAAVAEAVRIELQRNGNFECRYRTSGYTSAAYAKGEDDDLRTGQLREEVRTLTARLAADRAEALLSLSEEERAAVIRASLDARRGGAAFPVALKDPEGTGLNFYSAADPDGDGCAIVSSGAIPPELSAYFEALPMGTFAAVPRNSETEAFFAARQRHPRERNVVVSAEEVAAATGEDVAVKIYGDTDMDATTQVAMARAPQAAPGLR